MKGTNLVLAAGSLALFIQSCSSQEKFRGTGSRIWADAEASKEAEAQPNGSEAVPDQPSGSEDIQAVSRLSDIKLHLGADGSGGDSCVAIPAVREKVATKLLPIEYCLRGGQAALDQATLCLVTSESADTPSADNPCWLKRREFEKVALLKQGDNVVRIFAKDPAGTLLTDSGSITLNLGKPPFIDIISPTAADVAYTPWSSGEFHSVKWSVSDDDTAFSDLRVIVSLVDSETKSKFVHLACNFRNTAVWKQCPERAIEASPIIASDSATKTMTARFQLPAGYDGSSKFLVVVSSIDQSGNASVASTQEINGGIEVLAGRSYKGLGGSGVTVTLDSPTNTITIDRKKTLYLPGANLKVDTFDSRTCRMFKESPTDSTPADCRDAFSHNFKSLNSPWAYDGKQDVFYTRGQLKDVGDKSVHLIKIDFNGRTATSVMGGKEKPAPPTTKGASPQAVTLNGELLGSKMWFDEPTGLLLFKYRYQLFTLNRAGQVALLAGSDQGVSLPDDQTDRLAEEIALPEGDNAFAMSKDGRILMAGLKRPEEREGSGYGLQYLIENVGPAAAVAGKAKLQRLSIATSAEAAKNYNRMNEISYDPIRNIFFANHAWRGFNQLSLPPSGSAISEYRWQELTHYDGGMANRSLLDQIILDENSPGRPINLPRTSLHYSYSLIYAGANTLYLSENRNGLIYSMNLQTSELSRLIGFDIGSEGNQLGINRRLDNPRSLVLDSQGNLLLNDRFNLQKIELNSASTKISSIQTLISGFSPEPFAFNSTSNEIMQIDSYFRLAAYNYSNLKLAPVLVNVGSSLPAHYDIQFAISNNLNQPKTMIQTSTWDGFQLKESYMTVQDFGGRATWPEKGGRAPQGVALQMSATDRLGLGFSGCGGGTCTNTATPDGVHLASTFRLGRTAGWLSQQSNATNAVFTADDKAYVTCVVDVDGGNRFSLFDVVTKKVHVFKVRTIEGIELTCPISSGQFHQMGGVVYFGFASAIYALNLDQVRLNGTASGIPLRVKGQIRAKAFGSIFVTPDFVYYSDIETDRVLRNQRN